MIRAVRYLYAFLTISFVMLICPHSFAQDISIHLEFDKEQYVLKEPVKFYLTFESPSDFQTCIFDYTSLNNDMDYIQLEITYPRGIVERRSFIRIGHHGFGVSYLGIVLPPGEAIRFTYYPNGTRVFDENTNNYIGPFSPTFPDIGMYQVRIAYWAQDNSIQYSNQVELEVVSPTPEELDILQTLWAKNSSGTHLSHSTPCTNSFDRQETKRVINKYPDHPMIKYAMYGYAISLGCSYDRNETRNHWKALTALGELSEASPDFYYYEVQVARLRFLILTGQFDVAETLIKSLITKNPDLINRTNIVNYINCIKFGEWSTPDNRIKLEWIEMVKSGRRNEFIRKYSQ